MVKNIARLVLFLSVTFIGLLFFSCLIQILSSWINTALLFPPENVSSITKVSNSSLLGFSIPAAFYLSILFGLNYAVRRKIAYPAAFTVILTFSLILSGAAFFGQQNLEKTELKLSIKKPTAELAKPGFILNQGALSGYQTVFLENPYKQGAVVQIIQGQRVNYQSQGISITPARLPFFSEKNGILTSINRELEQSSGVFSDSFKKGLWFYGIYAGSLAVFLLSLGCLVNISFWSLANLIFGALAFRGVLALEYFLNQSDIRGLFSSFAGKFIQPSFINPAIFFSLSILILLYSGLVYLARGRNSDG